MSERKYGSEFGFQTRAVHTGNDVDKDSGAIKRPITMANSYELPYDPSDINWSSSDKSLYTRNGGTNQKYLEEKIASFEGSDDCIVLASGVAALSGLFFALLESGDHVMFSNVTYVAAYRLLNELLNNKFKVETTIVDTTDLEAVRAAIRPNTKLVHIETPGNPTIGISDIQEIAKLAHKNGALLSVDNTFASPYNQRPIELGADFAIESLTKFINGHGDAMGGSIAGQKEALDKIRFQSQVNLGGTISPFNAWLIMRGAVTFPLRMKQHNENALAVAKFLAGLESVSFVSYPGLPGNKGHEIAKKQMEKGFGGVLSFGLKADKDTCNEFVSQLRVVTSAVSLGHDESLIVYLGENDERQYLYPEEFHQGFFRFSVGIEDVEDIISDLEQALEKVGLSLKVV
ncbi:trans-sulfuration enzyme family protein [Acetobacterium tundrae]|uniref:Aminotransferase class V-fold PLP-dependent enzyme n=1 Tax=Acetobacterium tundrae TaxID=132932 RepID=A0ABR6WK34_9FIRM|nr:aminotransferase class I/II-fold pyridoxal phosphate-dependent enzyme [Acetobacterium tundrae]MBC3796792.1 aminotransferase class V-fold PLP-dependent enzyme [Acetobacterium tundrae]